MRFKDQTVWVNADEGGRPLLDGDGRAEMKYRETDTKSYRPSPGNLIPEAGGGGDGAPHSRPSDQHHEAKHAPAAKRRPAAAKAKAHAPGHRDAHASSHGPALEIWTDGACSGNPGPMGIGVVVIDGGKRRELGEYLGVGTNNIAELTAIGRGLDLVGEGGDGERARRIRVYSDSAYAIGLLEKGWKAKANQELVARLRRQLTDFPRVEFVKVEGHAGVPENERCDELARRAISRRGFDRPQP
jgi:ribonuclease HI